MEFKTFTFNPFQENTYVIYDETNTCVVLDAGNLFPNENQMLDDFFKEKKITPTHLINTHNHLDHIFGTRYLSDNYNVKIASHPADLFWVEKFLDTTEQYGMPIEKEPPTPEIMLNEGDVFTFGNTSFDIIHLPGHSPGGIAFYHKEQGVLFAGDSLFYESIGRTDLPGGSYNDLISAIKEKLFVLPDNTKVLSGHGPSTTIGYEKANNPFLT